jgi:hypothetical protein
MSGTLPLPKGMRPLLLDILAIGYPGDYAQARLSNAPDAAIAWQVQSMLDDYADFSARFAFVANDNNADDPDPDDATGVANDNGWRGLEAS